MKRTYSFAIILLIAIIAVATNIFLCLPGIKQLFFVPFTFYFYQFLIKVYPRYTHILGFAGAAVAVSLFVNDFAWDIIFVEFIWNVIGTTFTLLSISLYRHFIPKTEI